MSISDTLIGINSTALDTPLNHMIWLNDYKTYGENSYVFQNKDILHELYMSPVSTNDKQINMEAFDYFTTEDETYLGIWLSRSYSLRKLDTTNLRNRKSILDIIGDSTCISLIKASDFCSAFYELSKVAEYFSSTEGLKIASLNDEIMTPIESSNSFKTKISTNEDIHTITDSSGALHVENAFIISVKLGVNAWRHPTFGTTYYYTGKVTGNMHGSTTSEIIIPEESNTNTPGSNLRLINRFVKSLTVEQPSTGTTSNSITYIQLDSVV